MKLSSGVTFIARFTLTRSCPSGLMHWLFLVSSSPSPSSSLSCECSFLISGDNQLSPQVASYLMFTSASLRQERRGRERNELTEWWGWGKSFPVYTGSLLLLLISPGPPLFPFRPSVSDAEYIATRSDRSFWSTCHSGSSSTQRTKRHMEESERYKVIVSSRQQSASNVCICVCPCASMLPKWRQVNLTH